MTLGDRPLLKWYLVAIGCYAALVASVVALEIGDLCQDPKGAPGRCIPISDCQSTSGEPSVDGSNACVCCTQYRQTVLPEPFNCGNSSGDPYYLGYTTQMNEFPWTALIEYQYQDGKTGFYCGGTLINERYIVTAAHCVQPLPEGQKVHRVRLGEFDLTTSPDCHQYYEGTCAHKQIDLGIEKIVVHPGYDGSKKLFDNDIALIRFDRDVSFVNTMYPICLPSKSSTGIKSSTKGRPFISGWGHAAEKRDNDRKQRAVVRIKSQEDCVPIFAQQGLEMNPATQICGTSVDTGDCNGDPGCALVQEIAGVWYMMGVLSFGPRNCGTADGPDVYVNVPHYVDWIHDNIY